MKGESGMPPSASSVRPLPSLSLLPIICRPQPQPNGALRMLDGWLCDYAYDTIRQIILIPAASNTVEVKDLNNPFSQASLVSNSHYFKNLA